MAFLIGGANTLTAGYDIENSMRFDGTSAYAAITPTAAGNGRLWTFSCLLKRSKLGATQVVYGSQGNASTRLANHLTFNSNDTILLRVADGSGNNIGAATTNAVFRDTSAWYHFVWIMDTENDTAADRQQLWVNGSRITSWSAYQDITEDTDMYVNQDDVELAFGAARDESGSPTFAYFGGYLAELYFINAAALPPSNFGETDEDSGIWKPKNAKGDLTFGTNGFYMEFKGAGTSQDASGIGADTSGNDNHYAVNNLAATDQCTDTPTNNFCTMNPLDNYYQASTFSEGNLQVVTGDSEYAPSTGTIGVSSGKWYWEVEYDAIGGGSNHVVLIGIVSTQVTSSTDELGDEANDYGYYGHNGNYRNNNSYSSYGDSYTTGDIIGIALDLDNNKLYFSKNGTFQNSGDPTSGATGTGAISITAPSSTSLNAYFPAVGDYDNTYTFTFKANFGNPSFSISSGNADDAGYGNFEYDVPAGFYALCTKNLAEYG